MTVSELRGALKLYRGDSLVFLEVEGKETLVRGFVERSWTIPYGELTILGDDDGTD